MTRDTTPGVTGRGDKQVVVAGDTGCADPMKEPNGAESYGPRGTPPGALQSDRRPAEAQLFLSAQVTGHKLRRA